MKKCPRCHKPKLKEHGFKAFCKNCGYENDLGALEHGTLEWKRYKKRKE